VYTLAKVKNYVNNPTLLEELIKHKANIIACELDGKPKPQVPEYVGESILKIAQNLAKKPNFAGYSFKEDMIGDGIENCLQYLHNFNPEKSSNPFAYFTQIIHFAFLRRIQFEAKQAYVKYKSLEDSPLLNKFNGESKNYNENMSEMIKNFEFKNFKPKEKKDLGATGIELFME